MLYSNEKNMKQEKCFSFKLFKKCTMSLFVCSMFLELSNQNEGTDSH